MEAGWYRPDTAGIPALSIGFCIIIIRYYEIYQSNS